MVMWFVIQSWDNVEYFVDKYKSVTSVNDIDCDKLYDELMNYQTLSNNKYFIIERIFCGGILVISLCLTHQQNVLNVYPSWLKQF